MPLLRLASLIVATLLLAALSAFVPAPPGQAGPLSNQSTAAISVAPSALAAQLPGPAWSRLQVARTTALYGRGLTRSAGQSVPGAGQ